MDLCIFAVTVGNFTGYYRFLKGFYGLADIPTIFQEKIDQTLENKHPAWLDDVILVTKGSKQKHMEELIDVLAKLENAGYRLSESKSELFKTEIEWIGHKIDQYGIRPVTAACLYPVLRLDKLYAALIRCLVLWTVTKQFLVSYFKGLYLLTGGSDVTRGISCDSSVH